MGDSSVSGEQDELGTHRDTGLKLLQLNLTIATIFIAGLAFGVGSPKWEDVKPFLNAAMVFGGVSIVASTVLALLVVIESAFSEVTDEAGWLRDHLTELVGVTVVFAGWSLPLFATGVIVGLHKSWDLPWVVQGLIVLMVFFHAIPTWYVLQRSHFTRFSYSSNSPQNE